MLDDVLALASDSMVAASPGEASARFSEKLQRFGASYLQTRIYARPDRALTPQSHWDAGGFVARYARKGWSGSAAHHYVCIEQNPLVDPIRKGLTRYRFSDFAPHRDRSFGRYWDAMRAGDITDALCATAYGSGRRIASLHIGFNLDVPAADARTIQFAALLVAESLIEHAKPSDEAAPIKLTRRERDAMLFVADGKTDWEISTIMSISEATARFHVDNARRKLGAVNRAHAVARFYALGG